MLATDGNPTGRMDGSQYDPSQWQNTQTRPASGPTARPSATSSTSSRRLRSVGISGRTYDVQTYVVGMGDTLANASSVAALNQMANLGGGYPTAFVGSSSRFAAGRVRGDRRRHPGEDQRRVVGGAQYRLVDDRLGAVPGQVQQLRLVRHAARLRRRRQRRDRLDRDLGRRRAGQGAALEHRAATSSPTSPRRSPVCTASRSAGRRLPATPNATELDMSQTTALNQNPAGGSDAFGELRLRFLRGDRVRRRASARAPPCAAPQFRNRAISPLGDVINSSPYYVGTPNFGYYDDFEAVPYSAFVAAYRTAHAGHLHGRQRRHAARHQRGQRQRDCSPTCRRR